MDDRTTMMMTLNSPILLPAVALFVAAVTACLSAAYGVMMRLRVRADLLAQATQATKQFYELSDELLRERDLPDDLKTVLYDVLLAVTKDDVGRAACLAILQSDENRPRSESALKSSLLALNEKKPDVAARFFDAVGLGVNSILCSHVYSVHSAAVALAKHGSERSRVVQAAEAVERGLGEMRPSIRSFTAAAA